MFGLVGATGTDLGAVADRLERSLTRVGYATHTVRVVHLLRGFPRWSGSLPQTPEEERILKHMDAGDEFRRTTGRNDALAALCLAAIREARREAGGAETTPAARWAYVLRSLKRKEEVSTLRRIYGDNFILIGAYSPHTARVRRLASRIADSHSSGSADRYLSDAEGLVYRDQEGEGREFGQRVSDAFPLADCFVNASNAAKLGQAIERFVELLFGYPFHTPFRDEYGMFFAQAAALRSGSMARQVGAAICTPEGDVVAAGANEVPKAGGGMYWADDEPDQRDHVVGVDASDRRKRAMAVEVLDRLAVAGLLADSLRGKTAEELGAIVLRESGGSVLHDTQLMRVIEYSRAVHAEMAAISDAARRGVSVRGCTLYATTFPCHNCARHIVAAGIRRVVYVEPYPKSLALDLHRDAIEMEPERASGSLVSFEPFVGVAPRQYARLFTMVPRKDRDGVALKWNATEARPRIDDDSTKYLPSETNELVEFMARLSELGLSSEKG